MQYAPLRLLWKSAAKSTRALVVLNLVALLGAIATFSYARRIPSPPPATRRFSLAEPISREGSGAPPASARARAGARGRAPSSTTAESKVRDAAAFIAQVRALSRESIDEAKDCATDARFDGTLITPAYEKLLRLTSENEALLPELDEDDYVQIGTVVNCALVPWTGELIRRFRSGALGAEERKAATEKLRSLFDTGRLLSIPFDHRTALWTLVDQLRGAGVLALEDAQALEEYQTLISDKLDEQSDRWKSEIRSGSVVGSYQLEYSTSRELAPAYAAVLQGLRFTF